MAKRFGRNAGQNIRRQMGRAEERIFDPKLTIPPTTKPSTQAINKLAGKQKRGGNPCHQELLELIDCVSNGQADATQKCADKYKNLKLCYDNNSAGNMNAFPESFKYHVNRLYRNVDTRRR